MLDFEEWMIMISGCLTFFAKIKIIANWAMISDSYNGISLATVASIMRVNNLRIIFLNSWLLLFWRLWNSGLVHDFLLNFGFDFSDEIREHIFQFFLDRLVNAFILRCIWSNFRCFIHLKIFLKERLDFFGFFFKLNLLSLVIEIFTLLPYNDFCTLRVASNEDSEISFSGKRDLISIFIEICEVKVSRMLFEDLRNKCFEFLESSSVGRFEDVNFFIVCDFEKHGITKKYNPFLFSRFLS